MNTVSRLERAVAKPKLIHRGNLWFCYNEKASAAHKVMEIAYKLWVKAARITN